jgi:DNA-binding NarL/FixJ family response regulator
LKFGFFRFGEDIAARSIASTSHECSDISAVAAKEGDAMNTKALGYSDNNQGARLSAREDAVVRSLARGLTVSEIAHETGRSVKTVSQQKRNAMRKLGIYRDQQLFEYLLHQRQG